MLISLVDGYITFSWGYETMKAITKTMSTQMYVAGSSWQGSIISQQPKSDPKGLTRGGFMVAAFCTFLQFRLSWKSFPSVINNIGAWYNGIENAHLLVWNEATNVVNRHRNTVIECIHNSILQVVAVISMIYVLYISATELMMRVSCKQSTASVFRGLFCGLRTMGNCDDIINNVWLLECSILQASF